MAASLMLPQNHPSNLFLQAARKARRGPAVGRPADLNPLVEVSTGNILEADFSCGAMGVDAGMFVRDDGGQTAIYLRGRRDPILLVDATTSPMQCVSNFSRDPQLLRGDGRPDFDRRIPGRLGRDQSPLEQTRAGLVNPRGFFARPVRFVPAGYASEGRAARARA